MDVQIALDGLYLQILEVGKFPSPSLLMEAREHNGGRGSPQEPRGPAT
jgi:hypothetical protein